MKPGFLFILVGILLILTLLLTGKHNFAMAALNDSEECEVVEVIEYLRVQVPAEALQAWLKAERGSWQPWLSEQPGFLGRELFWDAEHQEGMIFIRWASRSQWKQISKQKLDQVQARFERLALDATGKSQGNPFPLVFEGELQPACL